MAYIKQTWVDDDPDTPISASRLTHIENGIYEASINGGGGSGGGNGGTGAGNARVLLWNLNTAAYEPTEYLTDTDYPREFVGPEDPATISSVVGPVFGDRWTPTGVGTIETGFSGSGSSFDIFEDPETGWPPRPAGFSSGTWIGWTDPTDLMAEKDRFIAIPVP